MIPTTTCLLMYVLLLSMRDPLVDYFDLPVPPYLTAGLMTLACCILGFLGKGYALSSRPPTNSTRKTWKWSIVFDVCFLSACAVAIYCVTFYLIPKNRLGAAGFNVIDFGAFPGLLIVVGVIFNKDRMHNKTWTFVPLYILGVVLTNVPELSLSQMSHRWPLILLAFVSPIAMALSDLRTQRLMDSGFDRFDVLIARFLIPSIILLSAALISGEFSQVKLPHLAQLLGIGFFCGSLPLMFLYMALPRVQLSYLAVWEMLLPVLIFGLSMITHPELQTWMPVTGLALILASYVLLQKLPQN